MNTPIAASGWTDMAMGERLVLMYTTTVAGEWDETDADGGYSSLHLGRYTAEVTARRGGWQWTAWIVFNSPARLERGWEQERGAAKTAAVRVIRHHAEQGL
jgi:hypothetical protein